MSLMWLDNKYLNQLSFRLRNFKRKGTYTYNMSCPFCGDSKTDKRKARGYIYARKGKMWYYCHKCNVPGIDVPKLLKHEDPGMYDEYVREKLTMDPVKREKTEVEVFADKMKRPKFHSDSALSTLKKISAFKPESPIKQWVVDRKIPTKYHYKLFFCKEFKAWVNTFIPGKFEDMDKDEPRLIIPFLDKEDNLIGFQGRSFKKNSLLRYITIMLDEDHPKVYGVENRDDRLVSYVLEGPIDSMFLPNALASAGSDVTADLMQIDEDKSKFIVVYDNEPRNIHTIKKIDKAIAAGYPVCIWPDTIVEKDINDMVLAGHKIRKIVNTINENTYIGLEAKLRLQQWKKV